MNLKSNFPKTLAIAGLAVGLLAATPAVAGLKGQTTLHLTNGCFSTDGSCGANTAGAGALSYAKGDFSFVDNNLVSQYLSGTLANQPYSYEGAVAMFAGRDPSALVPFADATMEWPNYGALSSDPLMQYGLYLLQAAAAAAQSGTPVTVSVPNPNQANPGEVTFVLDALLSNTSLDSTGTFEAWSLDDLNPLANRLFGSDLPTTGPVYFDIAVQLRAIPEPASMALVGLGLLGLGAMRRRKLAA